MYRSIMVPLDGSAFGEYALPFALSIARRAGATVELAHVCPPAHADAPIAIDAPNDPGQARTTAYLKQLATTLSKRWNVAITSVVLEGPAAEMLSKHATISGADLVVMTTHGRGPLTRFWLGSVADRLVRELPAPVLLVRPHEMALDFLNDVPEQFFQHMLIPLDGSALAETVVEPAVALGKLMHARYTLLQAIEVPMLGYAPAAYATGLDERIINEWQAEAQSYLDQIAKRMRAQGLHVQTSVLVAQPAIAILNYAREQSVDLIAMATHGRGNLARMLMGSVADKVVRGAGTTVLLQRPAIEPARREAVGSAYEVVS